MFKRIGSLAGDKGFTLVELLVTVTIIGVLAAVVTVGVSGASSTAQTQSNKQLFSSVQTGIDAYAASTPSAAGLPGLTASAAFPTQTPPATNGYYAADGTTQVAILATDQIISFSNTTNNFNTFFRLNNTANTLTCVVSSTTPFTLKACHN